MNRRFQFTCAVSFTSAAIALTAITGVRAADPIRAPAQAGVEVQAGFYTPKKRGELWDCWAQYHEGKYYQYYLLISHFAGHGRVVWESEK